MNAFGVWEYSLILLAIFSQYFYGKKLGASFFLTRCLVGVSFLALIAGCLAGFCAALVRPVLMIMTLVGAVCSVISLRQEYQNLEHGKRRILFLGYLPLLAFGGVFFLLNNPEYQFLEKAPDGRVFLHFNRHYSYYASQSIEMLNADYFSRLRIPNLYPFEWAKYHFFNSATQAIAQLWVGPQGLFTFFMAQVCMAALILMSIGEHLYFGFKRSTGSLLMILTGALIAFTFFSPSMNWNITTTGPFSVFAMMHLVYAIFRKKFEESVLFVLILGASAVRLLPISALGVVALWLIFRGWPTLKSIGDLLLRIRPFQYVAFLALAAYTGATVLLGPVNSPMQNDPAVSDYWHYMLTSYQLLGFLSVQLRMGNDSFPHFQYAWADRFTDFLPSRGYKIPFYFALLCCMGIAIRGLKLRSRVIPKILISCVFVSFVLAWMKGFSYETYRLVCLTLPYLFGILLLISSFARNHVFGREFDWRKIGLFFCILCLGAFAFQFKGPTSIKAPVAFVVYDILFLGVLTAWLILERPLRRRLAISAFSIALSLILFKPQIKGIMRIPSMESNYARVDISPLRQPGAKRDAFLDEHGFAKSTEVVGKAPMVADVYSAVLGARLKYAETNSSFMNNAFRGKLAEGI